MVLYFTSHSEALPVIRKVYKTLEQIAKSTFKVPYVIRDLTPADLGAGNNFFPKGTSPSTSLPINSWSLASYFSTEDFQYTSSIAMKLVQPTGNIFVNTVVNNYAIPSDTYIGIYGIAKNGSFGAYNTVYLIEKMKLYVGGSLVRTWDLSENGYEGLIKFFTPDQAIILTPGTNVTVEVYFKDPGSYTSFSTPVSGTTVDVNVSVNNIALSFGIAGLLGFVLEPAGRTIFPYDPFKDRDV